MAKATGSRRGSSRTQVSAYSDSLPDSELAKNHPACPDEGRELSKGADSQIGDTGKRPNRNWPKNRTYRKQTIKPCLTETRIDTKHLRQPGPGLANLQSRRRTMVSRNTDRGPRSTILTAFLTGSDSQTEIDVTRTKQTTEKFLTGTRTAISVSQKRRDFKPNKMPG
jgi:hypothetical protein